MSERVRVFLGGVIFCGMVVIVGALAMWAIICCHKDPNWMFGQNPFKEEVTVEETTEILFE